jgi:rhodanese-related sulfurtransferase
MNIITAQELKSKIDNNEIFQLIDVREEHEYEDANIGGINIPLGQVFSNLDKIDKDKPVIFVCNTGRKTKAVLHTIKRKLNLNNDSLFTLEGGLPSYIEEYGI